MIALQRRAALAACLALAACGNPQPSDTAANSGIGAPPLSTPTPSFAATALKQFPAEFQGRWGLVPADCEPGRADAKGLMEIGPDSLKFYESRATVAALRRTAPDTLAASLAFTGEGMTWSKPETFTLSGGALERQTSNEAGETRLRYARCPA